MPGFWHASYRLAESIYTRKTCHISVLFFVLLSSDPNIYVVFISFFCLTCGGSADCLDPPCLCGVFIVQ
jgi:hypothetical protein